LHLHQGKDAVQFLESLVTGDIAGLADGTGSLSVFTNEQGGIIDDTVITKVSNSFIVSSSSKAPGGLWIILC
jgi:aminomethyltransferase